MANAQKKGKGKNDGGLSRGLDRARTRARYQIHRRALSNRSSRQSLRGTPPGLAPKQQEVLERLTADGIAITTFDELLGDAELWAGLSEHMAAFEREAEASLPAGEREVRRKDDFLIRSNRKGDMAFAPDAPWLRFATSSALLDVVNSYLGMWSKLVQLDHWYTAPTPHDGSRVSSQRWHRDHIDQHIVKVFTYFSDVDADSGALEYVRGSAPGGRYGDLWPWRPMDDHYPPEGELEEKVPDSERMSAEGPPGTVVICDTSGFHRGGFASKPRVLAYMNFVSPASLAALTSRRFVVDAPAGVDSLPEPARFALT